MFILLYPSQEHLNLEWRVWKHLSDHCRIKRLYNGGISGILFPQADLFLAAFWSYCKICKSSAGKSANKELTIIWSGCNKKQSGCNKTFPKSSEFEQDLILVISVRWHQTALKCSCSDLVGDNVGMGAFVFESSHNWMRHCF